MSGAAAQSKLPPHPGPLAGMRVLELAQIMAGPTCGMMLADLGADVVKVEKLPGGDDARGYREPRVNGVSAPFLIMNRNKRGLALDLKHPRGRDILLRLVETADVLTENFRRGTLEKFGVGYDVLCKTNPGLIYCAVSGYGRSGPLGDKGGFDLIAQGFAGLMAITGEPNRAPVKTGNPVADINAGILAAAGIAAAYAHKLKTGQGQVVDTSLMEAALQQTYWQAAIYFATGESPGPSGSAHVLTAPYQAFRASDGWINIGGANQANWERIAEVLGHPEWCGDPRLATNSARMANLAALVASMAAVRNAQPIPDGERRLHRAAAALPVVASRYNCRCRSSVGRDARGCGKAAVNVVARRACNRCSPSSSSASRRPKVPAISANGWTRRGCPGGWSRSTRASRSPPIHVRSPASR